MDDPSSSRRPDEDDPSRRSPIARAAPPATEGTPDAPNLGLDSAAIAVVVLAAGDSTRMRSKTPKVLHKLAGRPMIRHVLDTLKGIPVTLEPVVVVVGAAADEVEAELHDNVRTVRQSERRGTGHAVSMAQSAIADRAPDVLVLYGDVPLFSRETLLRLLAQHFGSTDRNAVTFVTARTDDPAGYGRVVRDADGAVVRIVEHAEASEDEVAIDEINSGIGIFRSDFLWSALEDAAPSSGGEIYLTELMARAAASGLGVGTVPAEIEEVAGINTRAQLAAAEQVMQGRHRRRLMSEGVTLMDPATTWVDAGVKVGIDTVIWPNTHLLGTTYVGADCSIGPGSVLRNARVGDGTRIECSVVESAEIGAGCSVGPFAHLRPGAVLDDAVHVGNFGEIKNSHLGRGARMGHFGYVGDAEVGPDVNIGAGTVTCNYDGRNKHRTRIGAGAFIGSSTMLVAPVSIGANATTGAGSVVLADVPAGETVVGVPARPSARTDRGKAQAGLRDTSPGPKDSSTEAGSDR